MSSACLPPSLLPSTSHSTVELIVGPDDEESDRHSEIRERGRFENGSPLYQSR